MLVLSPDSVYDICQWYAQVSGLDDAPGEPWRIKTLGLATISPAPFSVFQPRSQATNLNMFSKLVIFATLALPVFAAATPASVVARNGGSSGSGTPTTACCASTEPVCLLTPSYVC